MLLWRRLTVAAFGILNARGLVAFITADASHEEIVPANRYPHYVRRINQSAPIFLALNQSEATTPLSQLVNMFNQSESTPALNQSESTSLSQLMTMFNQSESSISLSNQSERAVVVPSDISRLDNDYYKRRQRRDDDESQTSYDDDGDEEYLNDDYEGERGDDYADSGEISGEKLNHYHKVATEKVLFTEFQPEHNILRD
jgi:hypothetical protein